MFKIRLLSTLVLPLIASSSIFAADPEPYAKGRPMHTWVQQLRVKNSQVREEAIRTLGQIGYPARTVAPTLQEMAEKDDDAGIRAAAADSLRLVTTLPPSNKASAARVVVSSLADDDPLVRKEAILSITRLGDDAWYAVGGLRTLIHIRTSKPKADGDDFKKEAHDAEEAINKTINANDLVKNLVSKDTVVRTTAEAKFKIVKDHPYVKQSLLQAISDPKREADRPALLDIWVRGYELPQ